MIINLITINNNILNSCPTQGRVEGWVAMKPFYWRSVNCMDADRPFPDALYQGQMKCNETKWMRWVWENGGMKFVAGENGRNPEKNLHRLRFVYHEIHMEWPTRKFGLPSVGGKPHQPPSLHLSIMNRACRVAGSRIRHLRIMCWFQGS